MSSILAVWLLSDLGGLLLESSTLGSSPTKIGASHRTREAGGVTATSIGAVSFMVDSLLSTLKEKRKSVLMEKLPN